jgi:hypothetical protein
MSYKSWITLLQLQTFFYVVSQDIADSESRLIFIDIGAFGKQIDGGTFLFLLYITSWKTLNLPYHSLQVLREV